jgi:hypothetical protein
VQCRSCGARLASTIPDSSIRPIDDTHIIIQQAYSAALRGAFPDEAWRLGDITGAQFLHFVDDMFQLLAWYPSNELSPRATDPRNLHFAFRKEILANIGALVVNATVGSDAASRRVKVREGLKLWRQVLALLSHREASWIENAMGCWPPALRRRLPPLLRSPSGVGHAPSGVQATAIAAKQDPDSPRTARPPFACSEYTPNSVQTFTPDNSQSNSPESSPYATHLSNFCAR